MNVLKMPVLISVLLSAFLLVPVGCGGGGNSSSKTTHSISGTVSGAAASGVTVNLTGTSTQSVTTNGSGNYSFTGLANGTYTVTPSKAGYIFDPDTMTVTINGANVTGQNFIAEPAYSNFSMNGQYLLMMPMISQSSNTVSYTEVAGAGSFNGNGSVTMPATSRRVDVDALTSIVTTTTETSSMTYSVNAGGSFTLSTPDMQTLTGEIVLSGNAVLLDGTGRTDASELTGQLVGMKRVTSGPAPIYTNASLNGEYLFIVTEVHNPGTTTYCDQAGTATFDGVGEVTVEGMSRCSDGTTVTTFSKTETINYSVNADGSFTINTSGPKPLQGQIALDAGSLLLNGTMQGTSTNDYLDHGIAMKRVTVGTPPVYNKASLNGEYLFMVTEIHNPGTKTYCDQAGTVSFDGAGNVTLNGTSRCSEGGIVTTSPLTGTITYSVNADGSLFIRDPEEPETEGFHGQIVLDGRSLLMDATMRPSASTLLNHGIAMER